MKNLLTRAAVSLAIAIFSITTVNAVGVVDTTYGTNGTLRVSPGDFSIIRDMISQPEGNKIIVAGQYGTTTTNRRAFLQRYWDDGSIDTNFGMAGTVVLPTDLYRDVQAIALQPDGKIIGVGNTSTPGQTIDFYVFRLTTTGAFDPTFGTGGEVAINQDQQDLLTNVAIQPDGKIVATGTTNDDTQPGRWVSFTLRLNTNGTLDPTFGGGGFLYHRLPLSISRYEYQRPSDVEILQDGRILTGGTYRWDRPDVDEVGYYIQMIRADGTLDPSFALEGVNWYGALGPVTREGGFDATVLPDGTVAIASNIGVITTDFAGYTKRFNQSGYKIAKFPNGRFVVIGFSGSSNYPSVNIYSKNSLISTSTFKFDGYELAAQPDGKFVIGRFDVEQNYSFLVRGKLVGSQGTRQTNFRGDDSANLSVCRPSDRTIYTAYYEPLLPGYQSFSRVTSGGFSRLYPEYVDLNFPSTSIWRQSTVGWDNGAQRNGIGSFNFQRYAGDSNSTTDFGNVGDIPYGGDFTGDGQLDVGVFRNGVWYGLISPTLNQASPTVSWGAAGDKPVPADYDGDGTTDYAIYRPSNGSWWIRKSSDGSFMVFNYGIATDIPITGDYDGDGKADITVYRPSEGMWYQYLTSEGYRYTRFGIATDIPLSGDFDGDGKFDIAVYRSGAWYMLQSTAGYKVVNWGIAGDIPVTTRYDVASLAQ